MGNYSKLIGAVVGGVIGLLGSAFALPTDWATPEIQGALTVLMSALFTFFFPANKPS
jgi:hypothetical protein